MPRKTRHLQDFTVTSRQVVESALQLSISTSSHVDSPKGSVDESAAHRRLDAAGVRPSEVPTRTAVEAAITAIVNGRSMRAAVRTTGVPHSHIKHIVLQAGDACWRRHQCAIGGATFTHLECRSMFLFEEKSREAQLPRKDRPPTDFAWAWTCVDRETSFVPFWVVAPRTASAAASWADQLLQSNPRRVVVVDEQKNHSLDLSGTPDVNRRHRALLTAFGFGDDLDGGPADTAFSSEDWLESASAGFAKKILRHQYAMSLLFTYHNLATMSSSGASPAMAAGVSDHIWNVSEIVRLHDG